MKPKQIEIVFQPSGKRGKFFQGTTILEAARKLGVQINSVCGGKGICEKCKVKVTRNRKRGGSLKSTYFHGLEIGKWVYRKTMLACQTKLTISSTVLVVPKNERELQKIEKEGNEIRFEPTPLLKKFFVQIPKPSHVDHRSDEDRLLFSLKNQLDISNLKVDLEVLRQLPITLREAKWKATVVIWKDEILAIEIGDTSERCFGLAVDVGTTKLAAFLMHLNSGEIITESSTLNPQVVFGEDVISRISHVINGGWNALKETQMAVVGGINRIIEDCCIKANVKKEEIFELILVGNPVMQHLLFRIWPEYLARSPFLPIVRSSIDTKASYLHLKVHENAKVHFLPIIGGFAGADTVSVILASRMQEYDEIVMAVDMGTNTEICLGNKKALMAISCASGPAFEGGVTEFGMRAGDGAVEKVSINVENLEVNFETIGNSKPAGICGSGFIDLLAELLKGGLIAKKGNFIPEMSKRTRRLQKGNQGWEFVVACKDETNIGKEIVITQKDIRELQKAKAAVHAGAELLMRRMNLNLDNIDKLLVAGTFGNNLQLKNARTIGLYPEIPLEKIQFVGNLAGKGARMTLISKELRAKAEEISKSAKYYEIASDPNFNKEYIKSLEIPHANLERYPVTLEWLRKLGRFL